MTECRRLDAASRVLTYAVATLLVGDAIDKQTQLSEASMAWKRLRVVFDPCTLSWAGLVSTSATRSYHEPA